MELKGYTVGVVQSSQTRDKGRGPYQVVRLSPNGVFWTKEKSNFEKGQMIGVVIDEKNGRAKTVKLI